jgi:hypothetical protein
MPKKNGAFAGGPFFILRPKKFQNTFKDYYKQL